MTDKYFSVRFTVEGSGRFPLDMLRYDRCCPEDQSDSGRMEARGLRKINLIRFTPEKGRPPQAMRWASFGWYVRSADGA